MAYVHGGECGSREIEIDFSTNINMNGIPEPVKEAAAAGILEADRYPDPYCAELCEAIAEYEQVSADQVVCGNGASDLIFRLVQVLMPRRAKLAAPGFFEYEKALRQCGCDVAYVYLKRENGFILQMDEARALLEDTDVVFLCNPGNPTGMYIPTTLMHFMIEETAKRKLPLIVDECFLNFTEMEASRTVRSALASGPNVFLLKAFTKMFGIPGLRLGYGLCGNTELIERVRDRGQPWSVSTPAQRAGIAACHLRDYPRQTRASLAGEKQRVYRQLREMGVRVLPGEANYLFLENMPGLYAYCLERKLLIRDCSNYEGLTAGDCRIAIRKPNENDRLLQVIREYLTAKNEPDDAGETESER